MSTLFEVGGGNAFPLIFDDGSIKTIPMSKVHVNHEGVDSIPSNCFPILVSISASASGGGSWGWVTVHFSRSKINGALCSGGRNSNDNDTFIGGSECAYVPFNCDNYEDLLNGSFSQKSNLSASMGTIKYFVWAEK